MNSRALLAAAATCACAIAAPVASADPSKGGLIHATCSGQSVTVAVNGNGEFTPAHNVANTSVFIPTAFDLTFTFTPANGPPQPPETDNSAKAGPIKNTVTCTIPLQTLFAGPMGTQTIEGTVTGFWTPRG
jgi:hypothetical protein